MSCDPSQNRNSKVAPSYSAFTHRASKDSVWIHGSCNPSRFAQELRCRTKHGEVCKGDMGSDDECTAFVASPHSHDAHRHSNITQDEGSSFVALLRACAKNKDLRRGTRLHDDILKQRLLEKCSDALVTMYAQCGVLSKAKALLDMHRSVDVITWTALIAAYTRAGRCQDAWDSFEHMLREGVPPDAVTYACIVRVCGTLGAADKCKQVHDEIAREGLLQSNIVLGGALVDMYAKCGALSKAQRVLEELPSRNIVAWNALIAGYAHEGQGEQALGYFERMQREGISPDAVTYTCILKACGILGAIEKGKQIHKEIGRQGLLQNSVVLGGALVDMYAKCGVLSEAQRVLKELPSRNVVCWSALIAGYAQEGQGEQALNCFEYMQREGIPPNAVTYACILKACGTLGAVDKGEQIHDEIARQGLLQSNIVVGNALMDMYVKCGALLKAQCVLEELPSRDVVSWNTLITGYAQKGQRDQALICFERMQCEDIPPDAVTFTCVLNVFSHLGLVEEGHVCFVNMSTKYGVKPNLECYTCMIDLFGRAGHLEKAVGLIHEMPPSDDSAIWHTLLSACRKWGDVSVGRWAFEQAIQVDKDDGPAHVLMADIYAAAGMQENAKYIQAMRMACKNISCMQEDRKNIEAMRMACKTPGRNWWIDSSRKVNAFFVGDTNRAQSKYTYAKVEEISHKISKQGYSFHAHKIRSETPKHELNQKQLFKVHPITETNGLSCYHVTS